MNHVEPEGEATTVQPPVDPMQDLSEQAAETADNSLNELEEQLARALVQSAEYRESWLRAVADLSNARKRMVREQAEFNSNATARVLEKVLPIIDDVDRAFGNVPPDQVESEWMTGFRLIQRKLQAFLESEGVTTIPTAGRKFDPALDHAVSHEEAEDFSEGQIIAEVAHGYRLGDRVLRPAMVRVAKGN